MTTLEPSISRAVSPYRNMCANRRLILVDIENMAQGPAMTATTVESMRHILADTIDVGPWDQVVIGCSHVSLLAAMVGWPGARFVVRSGPDGADRALLEVLDDDSASRFAGLVLVSGDHIFAPALARTSMRTTVVSHRTSLSARLRIAASSVIFLPAAEAEAA